MARHPRVPARWPARSLAGLEDVHAVDLHRGDAVRRRHGGDRGGIEVVVDRGGLGVEVVLAEEDDRHLQQRREVERLVPGALVHGTIAEEADCDLVLAKPLGGERGSGSDGQPGSHDAHAADHAQVLVGDVHRAAAARG